MYPQFEQVEPRRMFAVTASFLPSSGTLSVIGDALDNNITVSRDAAGKIFVNGGAVAITGGTATVANTALMQVFGQDGNDTISLNESNGALPNAQLFGGLDNDVLTGGSGADQLFGQAGNDVLLGKGGIDLLFGGDDNDVLTGGDGDDQSFGQAGNDRLVWNPGDDTDVNEGGDGTDTIEVNGGNGAEQFTASANGTRVRFDRVNPAPFSLDIGTTENLTVNMNGGDDTFLGANGMATLISLTVDGGTGNDSITGGDGADSLFGGDGNDLVAGGRGNDLALMGAGDDVFVWNPGDGSDIAEGQDGLDTMQFNGANISEKIDISANGTRVRFTRDVAAIVMDLNDVETVNFTALGGADNIVVNDLSGTDLTRVNIDLGAAGGATGDAAADSIIVNGTSGDDAAVQVAGSGTSYAVGGLSAIVSVTNSEGASDSLAVNTLGGNDFVIASSLPAGVTRLSIDGGTGDDNLFGSAGADITLGGDGNDVVTGGRGDDNVLLGAGDDAFDWNPGDGSDTVEGQDGNDTMQFNGANVAENINVSANGPRLRFTRDVAAITMDVNGVELVNFQALGGADNVAVNDLTGTAVVKVNIDLEGATGSGTSDGQADVVKVNASEVANTITVNDFTAGTSVGNLSAVVNVFHADANDALQVNALGGNDTIAVNQTGTTGAVRKALVDGGIGSDAILVNGTAPDGSVTVLPSVGDDAVSVNTDGVGLANVQFDSTQRIGSLLVGAGGKATLAAGGSKVLTATFLNLVGTLDLTDNDFVLDYSAGTPLTTVTNLIKQARSGGTWNGIGLTSSTARTTPQHNTTSTRPPCS
jgi:Ca2+-binding RTX toxin-like protein